MIPKCKSFYNLYPHHHFYDLTNLFHSSKSKKNYVSCSKIKINEAFTFGDSLPKLKKWLIEKDIKYNLSLFGSVTIITFESTSFIMNYPTKYTIYLVNDKIFGALLKIKKIKNLVTFLSEKISGTYLEGNIKSDEFLIEDIRRDKVNFNRSVITFLSGDRDLLTRCKFHMHSYIKSFY